MKTQIAGRIEMIIGIIFLIIPDPISLIFLAFGNDAISLLVSIIVRIICIFMIIDGFKCTKKPQNHMNTKELSEEFGGYRAEWIWEDAAEEYLILKGKKSFDDLTQEETEKIFEYAFMPMIYFAMWLIENKFMWWDDPNEPDVADKDDLVKRLTNREMTPVAFYKNTDYKFSRNEILAEILPFVDEYFENRYYDGHLNNLDYCECIKNDKGLFYCIDFSWDIYDKIAEKINNAYNDFKDDRKEVI